MAKGLPDWYPLNQVLYRGLSAVDNTVSIDYGEEKGIITLTGKGRTKSGFIWMGNDVTQKNDVIFVQVDGNIISISTVRDMFYYGIDASSDMPLFLVNYAPHIPLFVVGVSSDIVYDEHIVIGYRRQSTGSVSVYARLQYYQMMQV